MNLDICIEDVKVGLEYQGIQHLEPIKYWGGKEVLKKAQERDKKKKQLCKEIGVALIYFCYNEDLTHDLVRDRISQYIIRKTEWP